MANSRPVALASKFEVILSTLKMMGLDKLDDDNVELVCQAKCSPLLRRVLDAACNEAIDTLKSISIYCNTPVPPVR